MLPLLARVLGSSPSHPVWWTTYALQQADLYVHLGLNRPAESFAMRRTFPLATEVTLLRAYAAAALWSGPPRPRLALGLGLATDVLDGALARRCGKATALGALLDGEYDASLWLAAARTARRRRALAPGAEAILWLRFGVPLLAGVLAYGVAPEPVSARSHRLGQIAGSLQAALLWAALSGREQRRPRRVVVLLAGTTLLAWAAHVVAYRSATRPGP
jgi:phosphatidylglycerophosphate synthase